MITLKKYLPYILLAAGVLIGMFLSGGGDKDLEKKYERERELLKKENQALNRQIKERTGVIRDIREKMATDSLESSKRLSASNAEIRILRKRIKNVNFKNADIRALDSIRAVLYGSDSLSANLRK